MANQIAYGFHNLQDVFSENISNVTVETLNAAILQSAQFYANELDNLMMGLVGELEGNSAKVRVKVGIGGELQPGSQNGVPIPIRKFNAYEQGWPFMRGMDSFGFNEESYAKTTVAGMNELMVTVQRRDAAWNIRRILAAMFGETTWTYTDDDDQVGALSIKGFANGDTDVYMGVNGDFAVDDHYGAQVNAIATGADNPYPAIYEELYEHPTNMEPFIAMIPSGLTATTKALSSFNINPGLNPFVSYGDNVTLATMDVERYLGFGTRVLGEADGMVIVESRRLPAGYIVYYAAGNPVPILKRRQEPEPSLQGLRMAMYKPNTNFTQWDFYRKAGYAVNDRVGGGVYQIGNGTYQIPANYNPALLGG